MTKSDDSILELLEHAGVALSLKGIEVNSQRLNNRIPYSTIKRRAPNLVESGLIEPVDGFERWYTITEEGSAYLAGDHVPPDLD